MSIYIMCAKCKRKYAVKNAICKKCGHNMSKDKNRHYYVVISVGGKKKWYAAGTRKHEAEAIDLKLKNDLKNDKLGLQDKKLSGILFDNFIKNHYIPHFKDKNKSYHSERYRIDIILKYFDGRVFKSIRYIDIDGFLIKLRKERSISQSTVNRYIARLKNIFNYAEKLEIINNNPMKKIKQKPVDNERVRFLSESERSDLLREIRVSRNKELLDIVEMALDTGMRKSEILKLKLKDINIENKMITVWQTNTKNSKTRRIPLSINLLARLKKYIKNHELKRSDYLYKSKDFRGAFKGAIKRANIENFTFHDLRHTFASMLIQNDVGISIIANLLGHSSELITRRYAHLAQENLINAISVLDHID